MHGLAGTASHVVNKITRNARPASRRGLRYRSGRSGTELALNIIPLVDVTFLLMVFFVIAGSFDMFEGVLRSRLPKVGAATTPLPFSPVGVRIERIPGEAPAIRVEPFGYQAANFAELGTYLTTLREQSGLDVETPVVFFVDDNVPWDDAVNGWNASLRAGFTNLAFTKARGDSLGGPSGAGP